MLYDICGQRCPLSSIKDRNCQRQLSAVSQVMSLLYMDNDNTNDWVEKARDLSSSPYPTSNAVGNTALGAIGFSSSDLAAAEGCVKACLGQREPKQRVVIE